MGFGFWVQAAFGEAAVFGRCSWRCAAIPALGVAAHGKSSLRVPIRCGTKPPLFGNGVCAARRKPSFRSGGGRAAGLEKQPAGWAATQAWVWRRNAMKTLRVRYPSVQAAFGIFSSGGFAMLPLPVLPRVQAAFCIHSSRSIGSQEKILLNRRFHSGASGSFGLADCVCGSYHCMRPCGSSRTW